MGDNFLKDMWKAVGVMYVLILVIIGVFIMLKYVSLSAAMDRTIRRAEAEGYIDFYVLEYYADTFNIDTTELIVEKVQPEFGRYVEKLGDPLELVVATAYTINIFGKDVTFKISIPKTGINQGYYGAGY